MVPRRVCRTRRSGFTLIELLVVITIIAVLAGLLFPVIGSVQDAARKTQAASDCGQIATAVKAYFAEYGKYPVADYKQGYDTVVGDHAGSMKEGSYRQGSSSSALMFNVLRAKDDTTLDQRWKAADLNPKQVIYFEGAIAKDNTKPRAGFANGGQYNGCYFDPFGSEYAIYVDSNYDGILDHFGIYKDWPSMTTGGATSTDQNLMRVGVGVASSGKDQKTGSTGQVTGNVFKGSDDVATW